MNIKISMALLTLGLVSTGSAETGAEFVQNILSQTNHTVTPLLEVRARYEYGEQEGRDVGNAATIRSRIGLQSADYNGLTGLIEFEATRAGNSTSYRAGPVHGDPARTVIADPESTELNRAQLQFKRGNHTAIVGRQRIILNNARFIGNVGWRQNEQTYDAATYKNTSIDNLELYYGFIDQVNRIFGSQSTGGAKKFDSDSHLFNAAYSCECGSKLTTYAYLLDFDNAEANSSDTYGVSYSFKTKQDEYTISGLAEFAYQTEGENAPVDYEAEYIHVNGKVARDGYSTFLGVEALGSDNGVGFKTPLATGHKFNGWNDQFLGTPGDGLKDLYIGIGLPVPKVPVTLVGHYFMSDDASIHYGNEFDAVASHAINPKTKAIAKFSYYKAEGFSVDRTRFSVEMNFKY